MCEERSCDSEAQAHSETLQTELAQISARGEILELELARARRDYYLKERERQQMSAQLADVQGKLASRLDLETEISQRDRRLATLQTQLTLQSEELLVLERKAARGELLESEILDLRDQLAERTREMERLRLSLKEAQSRVVTGEIAHLRLSDQETRSQGLQAHLHAAQQELSERRTRLVSLEGAWEEQVREAAHQRMQWLQSQTTLESVRQLLSAREEELAALRRELATTQDQCSELQHQQALLKESHDIEPG